MQLEHVLGARQLGASQIPHQRRSSLSGVFTEAEAEVSELVEEGAGAGTTEGRATARESQRESQRRGAGHAPTIHGNAKGGGWRLARVSAETAGNVCSELAQVGPSPYSIRAAEFQRSLRLLLTCSPHEVPPHDCFTFARRLLVRFGLLDVRARRWL